VHYLDTYFRNFFADRFGERGRGFNLGGAEAVIGIEVGNKFI
jgi:hypothetical protein